MAKKIAVIVDFQKDFVLSTGALPVPGAEELIGPMTDYVQGLTPELYQALVLTMDTHTKEAYPGSEEAKAFPNIHCEDGTLGWQLAFGGIKEIGNSVWPLSKLKIPVYMVKKEVFDLWAAQDPKVTNVFDKNDADQMSLPDFIAKLKAVGVEEVEGSGVATDYCVKFGMLGWAKQGFKVAVLDRLVKGIGVKNASEVPEYAENGIAVI